MNAAWAGAPRPRRQPAPGVRSGLKRRDRRDVGFRRSILEVLIEKGTQHVALKGERCIALEVQRAEGAPVIDLLPMMPRTHHEEDLIVVRVLRLDRAVDGGGTVDVLLVPQTMDKHHRHPERLPSQHPVDRLIAPEGVVRRLSEQLVPEANLLQSAPASYLARRTRLHELVVVGEVAPPPPRALGPPPPLLVPLPAVLAAC